MKNIQDLTIKISIGEKGRKWYGVEKKSFLSSLVDASKQMKNICDWAHSGQTTVQYLMDNNRLYWALLKRAFSASPVGYIYIIECLGYYKIGITKNINTRLGEYTMLMEPPTVIMTKEVSAYQELEKYLHYYFEGKNSNGEWFKLNENELKECQEIIDIWSNWFDLCTPDDVEMLKLWKEGQALTEDYSAKAMQDKIWRYKFGEDYKEDWSDR